MPSASGRPTKAETLAALRVAAEKAKTDPEVAHLEADVILLNRIADEEIADAYRAIPKWYA